MKYYFKYFALFFIVVIFSMIIFFVIPISDDILNPKQKSFDITDRNGHVLRTVIRSNGISSSFCPSEDISDNLKKASVAVEDRRYYRHKGIDLYGVFRALYYNIKYRRVVEGASTISQQTAEMLFLTGKGNLISKLKKMIFALKLELHLSKEEILEKYLNLAPYGTNIYGVTQASEEYFRRKPSELSLAQCAFLAGIPQRPSFYDPRFNFDETVKKQHKVLAIMKNTGVIDSSAYYQAINEKIVISKSHHVFMAPHFCDFVLSKINFKENEKPAYIKTTLDINLQSSVESLLAAEISSLQDKGVTNGAVIVMNSAGEILAMVGSVDYRSKDGQVNACLSARQGGSIMKPFTYALALDKGIRISEITPDLPLSVEQFEGSYIPSNYDNKFHGPVSFRRALACSYNIPAVTLLGRVGVESLYSMLISAGFEHLSQPPSFYGLGLTLGNAPVTLYELIRGYSVFMNGGKIIEPKIFLDTQGENSLKLPLEEQEKSNQICSEQSSFIIFDVLSDNSAREGAFGRNSPLYFPYPCAVKTGTSKSFRDNWTVGCTSDYIVGVWAGNFDNSKMNAVSGVTGAAPLFNKVMSLLHEKSAPKLPKEPVGLLIMKICTSSGKIPKPDCAGKVRSELFLKQYPPSEACDVHQRVCIDIRTGRLSEANTPHKFLKYKIYEIYPPIYNYWFIENGIKLPEEIFAFQSVNKPITIISPQEGEKFRVDPILKREYQKIHFKAIVSDKSETVLWFLDGEKLGETSGEHRIEWIIQKGSHTLKVRSGENESQVSFSVN